MDISIKKSIAYPTPNIQSPDFSIVIGFFVKQKAFLIRNKAKQQILRKKKSGSLKRKFSTMTINDCQLSRQKIRQKISVIKTNSFDWKLFTFDDIKKIVHFGILIHVLS